MARLRKDVAKISTARGDPDELSYSGLGAHERIELKIALFLSRRLCDEAENLDVEVPSLSDETKWIKIEKCPWFLSPRGRADLRKRIDEERARRFEVKTLWITKFWVPFLAALVGIIGALTGLVAVLQHKK